MPTILGRLIKLSKTLLFEPFVTGPLLLLLLRGPTNVRESLIRAFSNVGALGDPERNLSHTIKALKWLFAIGAVSRVNRSLNSLAFNRWTLRQRGEKWNFDTGKELVVITGGCSGFGALMTRGLVGKAQIAIIDVQDLPADMKSLAGVHFYKCDVTSPEQIRKQAAAIKSELGAPSVLINNAGIGKGGNILDASPEWIEKIFRVNLLSHWQLVQEFLPGMLEQNKGHIVSMASMASFIGVASMADYSATKAGLLAFHEALVAELGARYKNGRSIQTTILHPTWARTALVNDYADTLTAAGQKVISPEIVANTVVRQVLKGRSGGQILIPSSVSTLSNMRSWPSWLQELARGQAARISLPPKV